ncbi:ATP-binding protein [Nonomuraea sp. K271]
MHGVPSPTRHEILERGEANLIFQVISKRYEKGSIILASNKSFGKAHMFA